MSVSEPLTADPAFRRLRAQKGGFAKSARTDPAKGTAAARAGFLRKFEDQVDPDRKLPQAERLRRAEAARRAHMTDLALASVRSRRAKSRKGKK